jgi:hypothetical protein
MAMLSASEFISRIVGSRVCQQKKQVAAGQPCLGRSVHGHSRDPPLNKHFADSRGWSR